MSFFIASAILFHRHSFFVSFTGAKLVFFLLFFKKTGFIFVFFSVLRSASLLPDGCLLLLWLLMDSFR